MNTSLLASRELLNFCEKYEGAAAYLLALRPPRPLRRSPLSLQAIKLAKAAPGSAPNKTVSIVSSGGPTRSATAAPPKVPSRAPIKT